MVRVKAKVEDAEKKKYENLPEEKKKEVKVKVLGSGPSPALNP